MKRNYTDKRPVKMSLFVLLAAGTMLLTARSTVLAQGIQVNGFVRNYMGCLLYTSDAADE